MASFNDFLKMIAKMERSKQIWNNTKYLRQKDFIYSEGPPIKDRINDGLIVYIATTLSLLCKKKCQNWERCPFSGVFVIL